MSTTQHEAPRGRPSPEPGPVEDQPDRVEVDTPTLIIVSALAWARRRQRQSGIVRRRTGLAKTTSTGTTERFRARDHFGAVGPRAGPSVV